MVKPILEATGLRSGGDFFLGYSPEREDPGNKIFNTAAIPKIVAGDGAAAAELVRNFTTPLWLRSFPSRLRERQKRSS